MTRRTDDPRRSSSDLVLSRMGHRSSRALDHRDERDTRFSDGVRKQANSIGVALPMMFRENVGSADAGSVVSYSMRLATPSSSTAWATVSSLGLRMPVAGFAVCAFLWSTEARTAGTASVELRITDSGATTTAYVFPDCILDGTTGPEGYTRSQTVSSRIPMSRGIPFSAGDLLDYRIQTDGFFTPATADMACYVGIVYLDTN